MTSRGTRAETQRYMDVLTTRPSQSTFKRVKDPHASLLVEPVVLADMDHLSLDDPLEVYDDCAFYPTGKKNVNMKNTMEEMVRKYAAPAKLTKIPKSDTVLAKKHPKKKLDPNMPTEPMCYTRTRTNKDANREIRDILDRKLVQERALRSTVTPEL